MNFKDLSFEPQLQEGLDMMGFSKPTPIQEQAIPAILENKDLIACAQTGTGKTAAFVLPILNKLCQGSTSKINTIIVSPTRELALQIDRQIEGFSYFTNASSFPVYGGGTGSDFDAQKKAIKNGADILVCTPGRLLAHMKFNYFDSSGVKHFILDEADRMLDMGFYDDIMSIAKKLPKQRQNLMFSATMPPKIRKLASDILSNPKSISLSISKPAEGISQMAYMVHDNQKIALTKEILKDKDLNHVLIFCSTKKSVKDLTRSLIKAKLPAQDIHSDLDQEEREKVLLDFKNKKVKILVATDILSRGIDIKGIELVINYEVPNDAEDYVHRIGRTARADRKGEAITFINGEQCRKFKQIEDLIERTLDKTPLPDGFEAAPIYNPNRKSGGGNNFKKRHFKGKKHFKKRGKPKA
ncbi:DEAD/DEAH box helicase [Flavobacteriales bacterium]|jgi:ATP-dependent RNA helicase RhlE|nr:DEAD/DEAH box helicase [Flavobacteriales bacterium]